MFSEARFSVCYICSEKEKKKIIGKPFGGFSSYFEDTQIDSDSLFGSIGAPKQHNIHYFVCSKIIYHIDLT